jgi:hypothetical protein
MLMSQGGVGVDEGVEGLVALAVALGLQLRNGVQRPVFDPTRFADLDLDRTAWADARAAEPAAGDAIEAPAVR